MRSGLLPILTALKARDVARQVPSVSLLNGQYLRSLVLASGAKNILELGTAHGYSTIWIASALEEIWGRMTTVEYSELAHNIARENIAQAGLSDLVTQVFGRAEDYVSRLQDDEFFDAIFIDSEKKKTLQFFQESWKHLRSGGWMVIDDVRKFRFKMEGFYEYLESSQISFDLVDIDADDSVMFLRKP